ncbi:MULTISPECIES: SMP-30/gluconolactonase/LRE family protein [unclassified Bradyrhizobium]
MKWIDKLLGRREGAVTVPVLDGPFLPNQKLELAPVLCEVDEVDNLVAIDAGLFASKGSELLRLQPASSGPERLAGFDAPISAMAGLGEALAIGLDGKGIVVRGGRFDGKVVQPSGDVLRCPTAIAWLDESTLAVCNGSKRLGAHDWRRALMMLDSSGCVAVVDLAEDQIKVVATGLAWPAGVAASAGRLIVSECLKHRIVAVTLPDGKLLELAAGLPGYPARLTRAAAGGMWLCFYSVRNQLVEFILREDEYRTRMVNEVPEQYWMAPSLRSGRSFKEPMQGSQLKQMGILKPYSVTRSYGLVAYCDANTTPAGSFHSRADGTRHGAVAAAEYAGALYVASRGSNAVLEIRDPAAVLSE